MEKFNRHFYLVISKKGREKIEFDYRCNTTTRNINDNYFKNLIYDGFIPGIVRRCELEEEGRLGVGFSSPIKVKGERPRLAGIIDKVYIEKVITPYEILNKESKSLKKFNCFLALNELASLCNRLGIRVGVLGSVGMELITSLSYCDKHSDLDVVVASNSIVKLKELYSSIKCLEDSLKIRIDAELSLPNGFGVSLKEYFSATSELLGKSITQITMLQRSEINIPL